MNEVVTPRAWPDLPGVYVCAPISTPISDAGRWRGRVRVPLHVKVGRSSNIRRRVMGFSVASPFGFMLLGVLTYDTDQEKTLHTRYAGLHVRGEWYTLAGCLRDDLGVAVHTRWLSGAVSQPSSLPPVEENRSYPKPEHFALFPVLDCLVGGG